MEIRRFAIMAKADSISRDIGWGGKK